MIITLAYAFASQALAHIRLLMYAGLTTTYYVEIRDIRETPYGRDDKTATFYTHCPSGAQTAPCITVSSGCTVDFSQSAKAV